MKHMMTGLLLAGVLLGAQAEARPAASEASTMIPAASGLVVIGSMSALAGSAAVVVTSVEAVGEGVVVVLKDLSQGATASVRLSGAAAGGLSVATGTVVSVAACSTGYLLSAAGKAIAFIPNEVGAALLHHARLN